MLHEVKKSSDWTNGQPIRGWLKIKLNRSIRQIRVVMSHISAKRREDTTGAGWAFWGELQSSNFWMEFWGGEIKWIIQKGVLVSQAMAEHYGRRKEKGTTITWWRRRVDSTNNNSISFSLLLYIAYLPVHSRANFVYFSRSVLYTRAEKNFIWEF